MGAEKSILLVEDDPDEESLTLRALRQPEVNAEVAVVRDGAEALQYLCGPESVRAPSLPRLVVLDLKLPRVDGFDVISALRSDQRTRLLPVVVFSSSSNEEDVHRCYALGANGYVSKPAAAEQYRQAVARLARYWLSINQDPYLRK